MTVTQTVNIPASRRLIIDVPREMPEGRAVLTFTSAESGGSEYLSARPDDRERLDRAIENIELGRNIISFESLEQAIQCAKEQAAL